MEILGAHRWLTEHGATVHIVSPRIGEFHPTLGLRFPPQCATHVLAIRLMENAGWLKIDRYTDEASAADYDAVLLPGGCWNPDALRAGPARPCFRARMYESGKPTCAICHGQWVMVSAKILKGKRATAVWNIQIDLENAGATVLDEPCVVDGNLITARFPYDLPRLIRGDGEAAHGRPIAGVGRREHRPRTPDGVRKRRASQRHGRRPSNSTACRPGRVASATHQLLKRALGAASTWP